MKYTLKNTPYRTLYLDVNSTCQLKCQHCYNSDLSISDLSVKDFETICKQLSKTSEIRILGGEPTLHSNLFDMLDIAKRYHHIISVCSNGLRYADKDFVNECEKHRAIYAISLNGGISGKDVYKQMDNADTFSQKKQGLHNLLNSTIRRITLNYLLIRDLNEFALKELIDLGIQDNNIRYLKIRSLGKVGRYEESKPYAVKEFKKLLFELIPENEIKVTGCNECGACFRFYYKDLYISFVEFATELSSECNLRGKINSDLSVEGFFKNMRGGK